MAFLSALRPHRRPRSRGRVAVGLLALVAGALPSVSAHAAVPASGSVSDTAPTTTWSAGPFVLPNVSGTAGTVSCGNPQLCDDYTLKVSVPAGYDTGHSLRIDVKWPDSAADFDLYVLDAAGREVAASASSNDPEAVLLPAVSASYTVRVVPYAPLGQSFSGTTSQGRRRVELRLPHPPRPLDLAEDSRLCGGCVPDVPDVLVLTPSAHGRTLGPAPSRSSGGTTVSRQLHPDGCG